MSTTQQNLLLENLTKDINIIEKEILKISEMAGEISDKFKNISVDIENFSNIIFDLIGKEGRGTSKLIGSAFRFFGEIYADVKKEEALIKLAPKKVELAKAKTLVIENFYEQLKNQNENLLKLFRIEANREYQLNNLVEFENLHGEDCENTFYIYLMNSYLLQVCSYMIEQFKSWDLSNGLKDSENAIYPNKSLVLDSILSNVILEKKSFLQAISFTTANGGIWLLSNQENLFGIHLKKIIIDSVKIEEGKQIRVFNRNSFQSLKIYIKTLNGISKDDKNNSYWLNLNKYYIQAKIVTKLTSLNIYLFKYFVLSFSILLVYMSWSAVIKNPIEIILIPIIAAIPAIIMVPIARFIFWSYEDDHGKSLSYYILFLIFSLVTLFMMPIAFHKYKEKEKNYNDFINQLNSIK